MLSCCDWLTGSRCLSISSLKSDLSLFLIWWKMDVARQQLWCEYERKCGCVRAAECVTQVQSLFLCVLLSAQLLPSSHILSPIYAWQVWICGACMYLCVDIQCQTAGVPPPASQNRSIFNHVREGRLEMATWQRYTRSFHIYSWKAIFSQQTGSFALLVVWFIVPPRLKVYIYMGTGWSGEQNAELLTALQWCVCVCVCQQWKHTHARAHTHNQRSVPQPSQVSVMYGLPTVWQIHRFNSALTFSFDWSHTLKVRETGPCLCVCRCVCVCVCVRVCVCVCVLLTVS